jgi:EAL domain-containing protein (putative c-di-GMP-specific phosphodiesterase class I)
MREDGGYLTGTEGTDADALLADGTGGGLEELEAVAEELAATVERVAATGTAELEALLRDHSLRIVFHPVIDLETLQTIGFEALARFPDDGARSPATWFADAEAAGMIAELEIEAIRTAVSDASVLPADAFISLNASPSTAASALLREALGGIALSRIVLEIKEGAVVEGFLEFQAAIDALRADGVRIALDDAGTGFVSLRHVMGVRPDFIKIDNDITRDIDTEVTNQAVALALHAFAQRSGSTTIAEGIETEAELAMLKSFGVPLGQGYHFGRPQSAESFTTA